MKKLFIAQPMTGLKEEDVMKVRELAFDDAKKLAIEKKYITEDEELELIDQYHVPDAPIGVSGVWYLGNALQALEYADFIYFAGEWRKAKGCLAEKFITRIYKIPVLNEEEVYH